MQRSKMQATRAARGSSIEPYINKASRGFGQLLIPHTTTFEVFLVTNRNLFFNPWIHNSDVGTWLRRHIQNVACLVDPIGLLPQITVFENHCKKLGQIYFIIENN